MLKAADMPDKTKVPPGVMDHVDTSKRRQWEIVYREPYGRCIVASEDIEEGTILFMDQPLAVGPKQMCGYICLGCHKEVPPDDYYACSKCGWPMCGPACELKGYHPRECEVFVKANFLPSRDGFGEDNSIYEAILPLRCWLIKDTDEKKWRTLSAMESHDDLRRESELWKLEQVNVCDFLREKVKVTAGDALLHTITGILDVNCHEMRSTVPGTRDEYKARGLYPLCAMMSHDCFANTHHTVMEDTTMVMIACRDIPKGHQLTGIYTHMLSGTTERRKHLRYGKFFDCVCKRCTDPTELGTYFSALRCSQQGCGGDVLCMDPIQPGNKANYACKKCGHQTPVGVVGRLTNMVYYDLQAADQSDPVALEKIFKTYESVLHPNHFHLIGIKQSLSQLYGRVKGFLITELTEEQMTRKVECCTDVLKVLDVLDPGISRLRGTTKYELHAPILIRANKAFLAKTLTREDFLAKLREALQLLNETVYNLQLEPKSSFEGELCKISKSSGSELKLWIAKVQELPSSAFLPSSVPKFEPTKYTKLSDEDLTLEALLRKLESY